MREWAAKPRVGSEKERPYACWIKRLVLPASESLRTKFSLSPRCERNESERKGTVGLGVVKRFIRSAFLKAWWLSGTSGYSEPKRDLALVLSPKQ